MSARKRRRSILRLLAAAAGVAVGTYAAVAGTAWWRYGSVPPPRGDDEDELLDRFMPAYDVVERHHVHVGAPAAITMSAAKEQDLFDSPVVRAIFETRALVLGA